MFQRRPSSVELKCKSHMAAIIFLKLYLNKSTPEPWSNPAGKQLGDEEFSRFEDECFFPQRIQGDQRVLLNGEDEKSCRSQCRLASLLQSAQLELLSSLGDLTCCQSVFHPFRGSTVTAKIS